MFSIDYSAGETDGSRVLHLLPTGEKIAHALIIDVADTNANVT
jgi:hypothetical protein